MIDRESARVVLLGLDESLGPELEGVLTRQNQIVYAQPFPPPPECLSLLGRLGGARERA